MDPEQILGELPSPEFPKGGRQAIEQQIEELEQQMHVTKKGSKDWDTYSQLINAKERELDAVNKISQSRAKAEAEAQYQTSVKGMSGEITLIPKSVVEQDDILHEAKKSAAVAPAKPSSPPASSGGLFSRLTGWVSGLWKQREAGQKIAQAIAEERRPQKVQEEAQKAALEKEKRDAASAAFAKRQQELREQHAAKKDESRKKAA